MKYCIYCGAKIDDLSKFCSECGQLCETAPTAANGPSAPFGTNSAQSYQQPQAYQQASPYQPQTIEPQATAYPPQQNTYQQPLYGQGQPAVPHKANWAAVVGFILAICAMLIGLLPFFGAEVGVMALVFCIIGLVWIKKRGKKGLAIAGTIIASLTIVFSLLWSILFVRIIQDDTISDSITSFSEGFTDGWTDSSDYSNFSDELSDYLSEF